MILKISRSLFLLMRRLKKYWIISKRLILLSADYHHLRCERSTCSKSTVPPLFPKQSPARYKLNNKELLMNTYYMARGLAGMIALCLLAWLFSENKKHVRIQQICGGLLIQLVIAALLLKLPFSKNIFLLLN
ncbi:MAG: hypothetical protein D3913_14880 [Candidatus Electrothrix sp. LOE1_4_5]|nr:hypothetical protein [Candidatus Electrothrix gigas]